MAFRNTVMLKLGVTWADQGTDQLIDATIAAASQSLSYLIGCTTEELQSDPRLSGLLLNACLYEWNNAFDQFRANYASDILEKRRLYGGAANANEAEQGG